METFCFGFVALVVLMVVIELRNEKKRKGARSALSSSFRAVKGVKLGNKHISPDAKSGIGVSVDGAKVLLASQATYRTVKVFEGRDIMSAEVKVDGVTVMKTNRGSQLGGAVVGGVIAGRTGAVIGGLSGKQSSEEEIRKVELVVVVDNTSKPRHKILFYDSEVTKYATVPPDPKAAVEKAEKWRSIMDVVIRRTSSQSFLSAPST